MDLNKKLDYFKLGIDLIKVAVIVRLPNGKWRVKSHKGKNLGTYDSKEDAQKRLKQIEFFKHKKGSDIETTQTYTEIARDLNNKPDELKKFQSVYKNYFDQAYVSGEESPEESALVKTVEDLFKKKV